jgi:hypothetical protein
VETNRILVSPGGFMSRQEGKGFTMETNHQLAVFDGTCNECSNCEVYCPEVGAPFRVKERVFPSLDLLKESRREGFHREGSVLTARLGGRVHRLEVEERGNRARLTVNGNTLIVQWEPLEVLELEKASGRGDATGGSTPHVHEGEGTFFDTADLWRMKTAWEHIYHSPRPNPVSAGGGRGSP